jgi:hypothetical protein
MFKIGQRAECNQTIFTILRENPLWEKFVIANQQTAIEDNAHCVPSTILNGAFRSRMAG